MDNSLKIAICEDTESEMNTLLATLKKCSIASQPSTFSSAEDFLKVYKPGEYDLILMDIYMQGMTGVDAVSRIRERDHNTPIAFVTTSTDFALEGYRLSVLKYIEKPFKQEDLEEMLQLAKMKSDSAPSLLIQKNGMPSKVKLSRILYLEQQTRQVIIHMDSGETIQVYDRISNMLLQLQDSSFFNCHKSYVVNFAYVKYVDNELKTFVMTNGDNIPIRRESISLAKRSLDDYIFENEFGV